MKLMGSKSRIAKYIVPIIQKCINDNRITSYYEPFVGGANVIDKIHCNKKYGNDLNKYLIALLEYVSNGGKLLNEVPRELYSEVRANYKSGKYEDWYVGNIGFLASYNGRWFDGGYAKPVYEHTKNGNRYRDYYQEAKRNLEEQSLQLTDIFFTSKDYRDLTFAKGSLIYADPPYANKKQFANATNFDYSSFWETVRKWSEDNYVLVSEENAPDDFITIWEHSVSRSIKSTGSSRSTEKLFTYKNGLYKKEVGEC